MQRARPLLVFTDLDGTLLDHYNYSHAPAAPALQRLKKHQVPVVINTSKTFSEVSRLRQELGNPHPFIIENGSGIVIPDGYFSAQPEHSRRHDGHLLIDFGANYESICELLQPLKARFQFKGFRDMSVAELQEIANLPEQSAVLSKQRFFSEPLLWQDTEQAKQELAEALAKHNLQTLQGGRFLHIMAKTDKGQSLNRLRELFEKEWQTNCYTIALGDSANDLAMLKQVDTAIVVRSPKHEPLQVSGREQTITTAELGPEGWNESINQFLDERQMD